MFEAQSFQWADLASVGALIVLEGLLSADNALVLAILVKHLPKEQRQRALLYGLGGAFVFRLIAILFAAVVLKQWWLQAIGAAYLLYLPAKHFWHHSSEARRVLPRTGGFWQTVIAVELTDVAFALDSVLAGIGFITRPGQGVMGDKIWVVYLGAMIGIILLRFAASLFVRLLERLPALDHMAYALVGWVGVKLAFHALEKAQHMHPEQLKFPIVHFTEAIFWGGLVAIAVIGTLYAVAHQARTRDLETTAADMEAAQDLELTEEEKASSESPP